MFFRRFLVLSVAVLVILRVVMALASREDQRIDRGASPRSGHPGTAQAG